MTRLEWALVGIAVIAIGVMVKSYLDEPMLNSNATALNQPNSLQQNGVYQIGAGYNTATDRISFTGSAGWKL